MKSTGVKLQRTILQKTVKRNIVRHPAELSNILDGIKWNIGITSDIFKGRNNKRSAVRTDINWVLGSTNPIIMGIDTKMT